MAIKLFNQSVAGIDISDDSIQLVSLKKKAQSYILNAYANVSLPKNAVIKKQIKQIDTVVSCLKEAIAISKCSAKFSAIALADSLVMNKVIEVEKGLSEAELEEQIFFEASKHIPYPLSEVCLDYYSLANYPQTATTHSVLIAASRIEWVNAYVQVAEKAGLTPKFIDVESFVIRRACQTFVDHLNQHQTVAIINIGIESATVVVYNQDLPIFVHTESFGSQNTLDSEKFKLNLVQHLKRALQLYDALSECKAIEKIVLTGFVAALNQLDFFLNRELKTPVIIVDPFLKLIVEENINLELIRKPFASFMLPLGLALKGFN